MAVKETAIAFGVSVGEVVCVPVGLVLVMEGDRVGDGVAVVVGARDGLGTSKLSRSARIVASSVGAWLGPFVGAGDATRSSLLVSTGVFVPVSGLIPNEKLTTSSLSNELSVSWISSASCSVLCCLAMVRETARVITPKTNKVAKKHIMHCVLVHHAKHLDLLLHSRLALFSSSQ